MSPTKVERDLLTRGKCLGNLNIVQADGPPTTRVVVGCEQEMSLSDSGRRRALWRSTPSSKECGEQTSDNGR